MTSEELKEFVRRAICICDTNPDTTDGPDIELLEIETMVDALIIELHRGADDITGEDGKQLTAADLAWKAGHDLDPARRLLALDKIEHGPRTKGDLPLPLHLELAAAWADHDWAGDGWRRMAELEQHAFDTWLRNTIPRARAQGIDRVTEADLRALRDWLRNS